MKIFWIYLCDTCDHAGIWRVNFKVASSIIGSILDRQSSLKALGDRVRVLSEDKWMLAKFVPFQYPKGLNEKNSAHRGVLKLLKDNNIDSSPFVAPSKDLPSPFVGAQDKDKDKVMVKDTSSLFSFKKEEPVATNPSSHKTIATADYLQQAFNERLATKAGMITHCHGLSGNDLRELATTLSFAQFRDVQTWDEIFNKVSASDFLTGKGNGSFVATLNWLVSHDNALKVLNGQYSGGGNERKPTISAKTPVTPDNPTGNPYKAQRLANREASA